MILAVLGTVDLRRWAPAALLTLALLGAGLLPGYAAFFQDYSDGELRGVLRGPTHRLLLDAQPHYLAALALAVAGLLGAATLGGRRPTWLAPAALLAGTLPAAALTAELVDDDGLSVHFLDGTRAVRRAAAAADPNPGEFPYYPAEVDLDAGSYLSFGLFFAVFALATVWLGRSLPALARPRFAAAVFVAVLAASLLTLALFDGEDTCGGGTRIDEDNPPFYLEAWLIAYAAGAYVGAAVGATTRRPRAGLLLLGSALVALVAAFFVFVEAAGPCLS